MFQNKNSFPTRSLKKALLANLITFFREEKSLLSCVPDDTFNFMPLRGYMRGWEPRWKEDLKSFRDFLKENIDMKSSHVSPDISSCVLTTRKLYFNLLAHRHLH